MQRLRTLAVSIVSASSILTSTLCAAADTTLIAYDHSWRFEASGNVPDPAWKTPSFDDSSWAVGPGLYGVPTNEPLPAIANILTPLGLSNGAAFVWTFYFRTSFVVTGDLSSSALVLSNLIDDGAVFYLNGNEVGRIGMPTGVITNGSRANRIGEATFDGVEALLIPGRDLVEGTNWLAVEAHQWASDSSDVIFGMHASLKPMPAPQIIRPLTDHTSMCTRRVVSFSVDATGEGLSWFWYLAGRFVTNTPAFNYFPITPTNVLVSVVVSNINGTASSEARLVVEPDTCGPRVLVAYGVPLAFASNQVQIEFDDGILPATATNIGNYTLFERETGRIITVTQVARNPFAVRLRLAERLSASTEYLVRINGVADMQTNAIAPNTTVPVAFRISPQLVVSRCGDWWVSDGAPGCADVDPQWKGPDFVPDASWRGPLPALFWYGTNRYTCHGCDYPPGSEIQARCPALYFRTEFQLPQRVPSSGEFNVTNFMFGGAVFYLNGVEFLRYNMAPGPVTRTNLAASIGDATCPRGPAGVSNLVAGRNVLAVEVHPYVQRGTILNALAFTSSFGLSWYQAPEFTPPDQVPTLSIGRDDQNIVLSWPQAAGAFYLEYATDIEGPWREVQPAMSNPHLLPMAETAQQFFRLRR